MEVVTKYIMISAMSMLCFTDVKTFRIPNIIVIPVIIVGCVMTGGYVWSLIMFSAGAVLYSKGVFGGGDVKLLALSGAFIGVWALPAYIISRIVIKAYRSIFDIRSVLPYAPFWALGCLPFCIFTRLTGK